MNKALSFWVGATFCAMTLPMHPQDGGWRSIKVPAKIEVSQVLSECPNGWQQYLPSVSHLFIDVMVYDGNPDKRALLAPDSETYNKQTKKGTSFYKLHPVMKDGIWISCSYYLTKVQVCMKLPEGTSELRVYFDKTIPNNTKIYQVEYR